MAKKKRGGDDDEDFVSTAKEDRSTGGGLPGRDGIVATIKAAEYGTFDYNGTVDPPVAALNITFESDEEGFEEWNESYTLGKNLEASSDGERLRKTKKDASLNDNTKLAKLLDSLEDGGVDPDIIVGPASGLVGLSGTWKRTTVKAIEPGGKDGNILLLEEYDEDGAGSGKKKPAKKVAKKAKPAADDDDDEDEEDEKPKAKAKKKPAAKDEDDEEEEEEEDEEEEADDEDDDDESPVDVVVATISEIVHDKKNKKGVSDDDLGKLVFRALNGNKLRSTKLMPLIAEDDDRAKFLKKHAKAGEWEFDEGVVTPA